MIAFGSCTIFKATLWKEYYNKICTDLKLSLIVRVDSLLASAWSDVLDAFYVRFVPFVPVRLTNTTNIPLNSAEFCKAQTQLIRGYQYKINTKQSLDFHSSNISNISNIKKQPTNQPAMGSNQLWPKLLRLEWYGAFSTRCSHRRSTSRGQRCLKNNL